LLEFEVIHCMEPGTWVAQRFVSKVAMKKIIVIAVAAIIVLGGASAGVYFLMPGWLPDSIRPKDAAHDNAAKEVEKKQESEVGADLDVFVVNLAGSGTGRYLRTTLSLGVRDEHEKEHVKEFSGPIRHAIIMFLSEKKVEDLLDPEGKSKLRAELHKQINAAIGKKMVTNVYFKEFLIQ
jgi:flagellar basal body-associated protein FliL